MEDVTQLETVPSAGRGEVRLDLLRLAGPEAGRAKFERLVTDLVKVIHPTAREVRANPGDWGIDTFVGELDGGTVHVWQSKYFIDGVATSQQNQIRDAFRSVTEAAGSRGFEVASWTLVIANTLDAPMTQWWDNWRKRKPQRSVEIALWAEADIRSMLLKPDFADVSAQYFGSAPGSTPTLRAVAEVLDPGAYDSALFIKQLHVAGISDDTAARRAFFNAEVMTRDINERESRMELQELHTVRGTIHQMWHARYEAARAAAAANTVQLPSLYPNVCLAIERYHAGQSNQVLRDTLVHRTGLAHHLAEDGQLGWIVGYKNIAESHQR
jgi:hypothetical protein